jgi:hypothetical protein
VQGLPDFFDTDLQDTTLESPFLLDTDDQSQQPSIDALLGEDPMRMSAVPMSLRQSTTNNLFSMAISQARETNRDNIFSQQPPVLSQMPRMPSMAVRQPSPSTQQHQQQQQQQQQVNYQLLRQLEQMLSHGHVPAQERMAYIQTVIEKMQRDAANTQQQQQQATRVSALIVSSIAD